MKERKKNLVLDERKQSSLEKQGSHGSFTPLCERSGGPQEDSLKPCTTGRFSPRENKRRRKTGKVKGGVRSAKDHLQKGPTRERRRGGEERGE